jgi:ketosteroid isomerase-like protein
VLRAIPWPSMAAADENVAQNVHDVLSANQAIYDAFEARDLAAMRALWIGDGDVLCTHPGWPTLHGAGPVLASWETLLSNDQHLQFIVTNARATVVGDAGWVTCDENVLGGGGGGTVAALNLFRRRGDGTWQVVGHHGSPIMT